MKRGKPHKQETQILVGELKERKRTLDRIEQSIDKCLSPRNRNRTWLMNDYFFNKRGVHLKEIGEKLKEAREGIGVSIEEAAEDLKLNPSQIENIENGNMEAFQDIFYLKYFIRDYAKYLGLDKEDLVDEFNEYLFDYTSKISLDDIKNAREKKKEESSKIRSPYTIERKKKVALFPILVGIFLTLLVIGLISLIVVLICDEQNKKDDNIVATARVIGGNYEFTK